MNCNKCGSIIPNDAMFCAFCGAPIEATPAVEEKTAVYEPVKTIPAEPASPVQSPAPQKPKKSKKGLVIGIIAAVLALLAAAAAVFFFVFKNRNKELKVPLIYYTENKLYATEEVKENEEAFEVCTDYAGDYKLTSDNKYIVYTQNLQEHGSDEEGLYYTSDLYYTELFNKKFEPVLLAKGISDVRAVSGAVDAVYYEKNDAIYKTDKQLNTDKLLDNAYIVEMNLKDGRILSVSGNDYDEESGEMPASEISMIDLNENKVYPISSSTVNYNWSDDLSKVYFLENGTLYCSDAKGNREKISDGNNVNEFYYCEDCVYYTVIDKTFSYLDLVADPEKKADEKMKEPKFEDYAPKQEDFVKTEHDDILDEDISVIDYEAFEKAQTKAIKDYDAAYTKYLASQNRKTAREMLEKEGDSSYETYSLYLYNGSNKKLCSNVSSIAPIITTKNKGCGKAIIYCFKTPLDKLKKLDILKVTKPEEVTDYIEKQIVYSQYIASGETLTYFNTNSSSYYTYIMAYDESEGVYLASGSKPEYEGGYDLYTLKDGESFKQAKIVANECSNYFYIGGKMGYFNDFNEKSASYTLHYDGGKIDDVSGQILLPTQEDGSFYYSTDYNEKTNLSTVYRYKDKQVQKIADDVMFSYSTFGIYDGKYLYVKDFDVNDFCGTLICKGDDGEFELAKRIRGIDNVNMTFAGEYE